MKFPIPPAVNYRGIIFDFNGVLLWDTALHIQAWQTCALQLRGTPLSEAEFSVHVYGRTNAHILKHITCRQVCGTELDELTQIKESLYRQLCLENSEQFILSPGAAALLDYLADHSIPRTIATASEKTNLDFFVAHLDLEKWFDLKKIVYDNGIIANKPAPDIYLQAAARIGVAPQRCVVVEDALSGIQAAYAAGIGCIIGLGPKPIHDRLLANPGVCAAIENLEQFPRQLIDTTRS